MTYPISIGSALVLALASVPASGCPLRQATYVLDRDAAITLTFEDVTSAKPHGESLLDAYPVLNRHGRIERFVFGGATNGDLLIMKGFDAAIVVDMIDKNARPYRGDWRKVAAPRLVTRNAAGVPRLGVPEGRWTLRCQ
jgi:hypothetical protein